jgi:hypothetical protein
MIVLVHVKAQKVRTQHTWTLRHTAAVPQTGSHKGAAAHYPVQNAVSSLRSQCPLLPARITARCAASFYHAPSSACWAADRPRCCLPCCVQPPAAGAALLLRHASTSSCSWQHHQAAAQTAAAVEAATINNHRWFRACKSKVTQFTKCR